ncbi:MAG: type II toxin-antitoxin system VapC family toxin [Candidatus Obscuribacter sp.]|nr:type II toxin-antitoxin system VapC family toxin [Candidatus Obscuribacter sp.]
MTEKLLVTDTHPVIYFFCDGGRRLSKKALTAFREAVSGTKTVLFVPVPVLWELSILVENGDIELDMAFSDWIDNLFRYPAINPLPFDVDIVKVFHDVRFHNDPFDRAPATALQMDLPLISNDQKMHEHKPCKLFWD